MYEIRGRTWRRQLAPLNVFAVWGVWILTVLLLIGGLWKAAAVGRTLLVCHVCVSRI